MSKLTPAPAIRWVGDRTLRVSLGGEASLQTHGRVRALFEALRAAGIPGLVDLTPAYTTVLLHFDPGILDPPGAEISVRGALGAAAVRELDPPRRVEIPVCYEGDCAPDLEEVAHRHGLTAAQVVALHAGPDYVVAFLGFSPGFPYLLGLPAALATPRLDRPRLRVPAGSVGIAGGQTGVYPSAGPGGWRLIGRTPSRLFDADRPSPALLRVGDRVRFVPIPREGFDAAGGEA